MVYLPGTETKNKKQILPLSLHERFTLARGYRILKKPELGHLSLMPLNI